MPDKELTRLQQAKDREDKAIKLLVLKLLHLKGVIAFDASEAQLDPSIEELIKGEG